MAKIIHYPAPTAFRRALGWASVSLFTSALVMILIACVVCLVLTFRSPWKWGPLLAIITTLSFYPHKKWSAWERAWCYIFEIWCEIFQTTLIYESDANEAPPKSFMLTVHPHGVIPIVGMKIWGATCTHGLHPDSFGGSDAALRMPLFRQFLMWNGGVSASKDVVKRTLKQLSSFSIFSGGIREMMATDNDKETLVLKSRVGVIKLAKEYGKTIVPVLVFGCTEHFRRWPSPHASWLRSLSSSLQCALLVPYGWLGLPIPFYARTTIIFGSHIDVNDGSAEELHARWIAWYVEAYEKYKVAAGCADRELVIL